MEQSTIARSYASALFELGERTGDLEAYTRALAAVNALLDGDRRIRDFVRSPRIGIDEKKRVLRQAFDGRVPPMFLNFLLVVLDKRRQRLLRPIAREFDLMLDQRLGRVNVQVTLAHSPDSAELAGITANLSRIIGRAVIPHVQIDRSILGGIIVRYSDRLLDGSLRRRLVSLRRRLLETTTASPQPYRG